MPKLADNAAIELAKDLDMPPSYIGIDPGKSGGIACIGANTQVSSLSYTDRHAWDWIQLLKPYAGWVTCAVIEKNTGYVGGAGNPGSAMFQFGRNTGLLTGFLIAAGIPYEEITPAVWQKALGIPPRKRDEKKGAFKNRLKAHAERLFPQMRVTLSVCDALLIATYCKRKHEGTLGR